MKRLLSVICNIQPITPLCTFPESPSTSCSICKHSGAGRGAGRGCPVPDTIDSGGSTACPWRSPPVTCGHLGENAYSRGQKLSQGEKQEGNNREVRQQPDQSLSRTHPHWDQRNGREEGVVEGNCSVLPATPAPPAASVNGSNAAYGATEGEGEVKE